MSNYIIVDANNLFHRCKHITSGDATLKSALALHVILSSIKQVWKKYQGSHVVIALDGRSWRRDFYPDYKAHRRVQADLRTPREKEEDRLYFDVMKEFTDFIEKRTNCTFLHHPRIEADDFVARWIDLHPTDNHVIVATDTDFVQLLAPNVRIYDGVKEHTIAIDGVLDAKGNPATKSRKVKVKDPKTGKEIPKTVTEAVEPPNPEWELFKKIIRGDSSDNIMSAYPRAPENGTRNKTGMKEAFEDRHARGFHWNNFMLQEWDKLLGMDKDGNPETKRVLVLDEYHFNKSLIDLRAQPQEIVDIMDAHIVEKVQRVPQPQVGVWFLRFCEEMGLTRISQNPKDYAEFLAAPYNKK